MSDLLRVLDEIQARADAATEGPWEVCISDSGHSRYEMEISVITEAVGDHVCGLEGLIRSGNERDGKDDGHADAEFIAAARQDIPRLVAAVRAVLDRHSDDGHGWCQGCGWDTEMHWLGWTTPFDECPTRALVSSALVGGETQ